MKRTAIAALLLVLVLLAACTAPAAPAQPAPSTPAPQTPDATVSDTPAVNDPNADSQPAAVAEKLAQGVHIELPPLAQVTPAESYEQVLRLFLDASDRTDVYRTPTAELGDMDLAEEAETEAPAAAEDSLEGTGTNIQVPGVDEADVVKTDGSWIYVLGESGLQIYSAAGADTARVSVTDLNLPRDDNHYSYLQDLFVAENRVAVRYNSDTWGTGEDGGWFDSTQSHLAIYDTTDKAAPKLLADLAQDGDGKDARLLDGVVYLISTRYLWTLEEDSAESDFVPCVYTNDTAAPLAAERLFLCPNPSATAFTVVSAIRLSDGVMLDSCAFTDGTDTVYMDADALYLTRTAYNEGESEPYTEAQYTVVDHSRSTVTEIKRLSVAEGKLELTGSASVTGSLLNQFSMDVHNGYLRLATTTYDDSWSVYTDPTYGWDNYIWYDNARNNRVTILDSDLNQVGLLDQLVQDESIYSVRFLDDVAYVVTYETVDPVFTIDLSDPANPTLCSALEVAGVSDYLHPYGEGLLFGFGRAVDENAVSSGLQLSMFDVSDPANVHLAGQSKLEEQYSDALYNHKAILVNPQRNLIGFAVDDYSYEVYSYENGQFTSKGSFQVDYMPYDARAMLAGEYLYICSADTVYAVDPDTLQVLATVTEAVG